MQREKKLTPGLIDRHVHVTGGGGEGSFHTRTPQIQLSSVIRAGITTLVGLLGTDDVSRTPEDLIAKVKALKEEGISAYALLRRLWCAFPCHYRKHKEGYCLY